MPYKPRSSVANKRRHPCKNHDSYHVDRDNWRFHYCKFCGLLLIKQDLSRIIPPEKKP